jgi:hypothetical protein
MSHGYFFSRILSVNQLFKTVINNFSHNKFIGKDDLTEYH